MALLDVLTRLPQLPRAVERPRLGRLLSDGAEPACLLVAPVGSGKTVAAAQLLRQVVEEAGRTDVRTGWCRVAPGAAGGEDLVRLVARALGGDVADPGATPLERAAVLLDLLSEDPVVLVVDDYDLARPEECDSMLAEVFALAPPGCRIVICSANRPTGLIGRASVGQVRMVGPTDLAFTEAEVEALLELHGQDPGLAADLWAASSGWATAAAVLAEMAAVGAGADLAAAIDAMLGRAGLGDGRDADDLLAVVSLVPAISSADLVALGLDAQRLVDLAHSSALLRPVGDGWALLDLVRRPLQHRLGAARLRTAAARVAPVLAATDPVAAADLLTTVGDHVGAADLLARWASAVSPEAVLPLLYRMPSDVRRRLPPLLSAARATVEMDTALAGAEQRLAAAHDPRERLEAQVAVGTILLHRGQLASAAAILESALRGAGGMGIGSATGEAIPPPGLAATSGLAGAMHSTPAGAGGGTEAIAATAAGWLALARFWAGDIDGAAAVVAPQAGKADGADSVAALRANDVGGGDTVGPGETENVSDHGVVRSVEQSGPRVGTGETDVSAGKEAGGSALVWWVAGEVALARDDLAAVEQATARLQSAGWSSAAGALTARLALARGDEAAAAAAAATAYRAAAASGGIDLLVAAPVHAWCLARSDRWDEAAPVADDLRRRLGSVDTCARLHADLVAEAWAAHQGDVVARRRAARAVATTRRLGYAPVETTARRWLPAPAALGATPRQLGERVRGASGGDVAGEQPGLEVGLLGPVTIRVDGQAVLDGAWRSRKAREVLLVLALAGATGLGRDEVIEAVWPERDPAKGRMSLRTALSEVRQALEPARPPGEPSRFVTTRADRVTLQARTDVVEAERLLGQATAGAEQLADAGALVAAWSLFRGRFAADEAYTASLDEARRAAERLHLDVAEAVVVAGTEGGGVAGAAGDGGAPSVGSSVTPELLVAAAAHVLSVEPWRTDVVRDVAAACRAASDEVQARRAERLAGPTR
jgi:hypothetical protein